MNESFAGNQKKKIKKMEEKQIAKDTFYSEI